MFDIQQGSIDLEESILYTCSGHVWGAFDQSKHQYTAITENIVVDCS